jgi:gamma-glutamyltranspeptidase/glutathione hydrolase
MSTTAFDFDWTPRHPMPRLPVFGRNVVATSHPLAAQAGLKMLMAGGNAVDAAIAAAAAMTIVEPVSNGLGSDAFCILWDGTRLHGLNASGRAPAAWTPAWFAAKCGADAKTPPLRGWDSVTVPGAIAGWAALSERFGKLAFGDLLQPAIEIAERGYAVPIVVQQKWAAAAALPELNSQPGFARVFLPHDRAPRVGELFRFADAARTLRRIAETKGEAYYRGDVAEAIARHAHDHGAALTAADLAAYAPEWVETIGTDYRGHVLHEIPPNGQGIAALIALGILRRFDLGALPADSVASQHLQIEAMKLAFADVHRYVAEPASMEVTPAQMLDDAYLAERAKLVDPKRAQLFGAGNPAKGGTIYLTAADERGMMVSFIQSNYMGFGSGVVVPGIGVSLQNRAATFVMTEGHPNRVGPKKKPYQTIIPGFVTKAGKPVMSFGVMGGQMQPQGHAQMVTRIVDYHQNPQSASDGPRWIVNNDFSVSFETERFAPGVLDELKARGHRVVESEAAMFGFGGAQLIWRLDDGYCAASDHRKDGHAIGY